MYDQITADLQRENAELRTKLEAAEKSRDKALSDLNAKCDQYAAASQCVFQLEKQNEKWREELAAVQARDTRWLEINLAAVIQRAEAAEKALADCTKSHVRTNTKLAEAEQDADLLDWLIDRLNSAEDTDDLWDLCPGKSDDVHEEFRAAIRAAREGTK